MWYRNTLSFLVLILLITFGTQAQDLNNENIWYQGAFRAERVSGFNFLKDGFHYTQQESGKIVQYNFHNKKERKVIFNSGDYDDVIASDIVSYAFSDDERFMILETEKEAIYRHSYYAICYVYDRIEKKVFKVFDQPIQVADFSPSNDKVGFVFENNLYYFDINTRKTFQVTTDGINNEIINGHADWVYEEEFSLAKMYQWSPDGKYLAYVKFNETEVPEFSIRSYNDDLYPTDYQFKYPKVGQNNSEVSVHVYNTMSGLTFDLKKNKFMHYVPRLMWVPTRNELCIMDINRHQNQLRLSLFDPKTSKTRVLLRDSSQYYLDIRDDIRFTSDGERFFWMSPISGFDHIYEYSIEGKKLNTLTQGDWSVTQFYGFNEGDNTIYYQAAKRSPLQREIYKMDLTSGKTMEISTGEGKHNATFNNTLQFYIDTYSQLNQAAIYSITDKNGELIKIIEDNDQYRMIQDSHEVGEFEFIQVPNADGIMMNAYILPPSNLVNGKKFPMLMFVYGGPGSQMVMDQMPRYYWWFQMLAKKGYYIACVDGTGTGARGEEFQKSTYLKLGDLETRDQIDAALYFGKMKSVDKDRIGIFGWSYGGYLSTLCILKGHDVFNAAVAVAPVTNWRWYDSIYTERFMRTEKENEKGYADNSPVNFAHLLEGDYLIVHGTGDDNVHPQHSYEMINQLIANNKKFDMYLYPNKNHGIYGSFTRWHLFDNITAFIEEKL